MSAHIVAETSERVARITLARPDKKNALTLEMYQALAAALAAAEADPQVRATLIHGKPDCFCSGNDLKDFLERPPHGERSPTFEFLRALSTLGKPLVAAVRARFPRLPLMVDANSAYTLADADHLAELDRFALTMIEQPLGWDDVVDHAALQRRRARAS